jgi:SRSO17 transposase
MTFSYELGVPSLHFVQNHPAPGPADGPVAKRKSVEPMAAITAPHRTAAQHQSLLHFIGEGKWSDEKVLAKLREMVLRFPLRTSSRQALPVAPPATKPGF